MNLRPAIVSLFLALLVATASAQRVAELLPAETVLALGLEDLASHEGKLQPFIDEFERLGLGEALTALAQESEEAPEVPGELPAALSDLDPLDVFGREVWLAVSVSQFNPIPAVTVVARVGPDSAAAISQAIADNAGRTGAQEMTEGSYTFYLLPVESGEGEDEFEEPSPVETVAVAQADDLALLSTNPDTLRGVLRRLGGGSEAGFTASSTYSATLGSLGNGNTYFLIDYATLARSLQPFAQGMGFDTLVQRLANALVTAGSSASVVRITDSGTEAHSIQVPNAAGGDAALYDLMLNSAPASRAQLDFVPAQALGVTAARTDFTGWWNYLGDLVASSPELGVPDLDSLIESFTGVAPRTLFFDWTGTQFGVVTTGVGEVAEPGVPSANLLGESVYLIETIDEAAAREGLALLLNTVSSTVAGFADPSGGAGSAELRTRNVHGVDVTSYDVSPGVTVAYAITDGWALIATSDDAIDSALAAHAGGGSLPAKLQELASRIPENAKAYSVTDDRATLEAMAGQIATQLQTFAGLSGGQIDFEAVQNASAALEEFLGFVASRLGGSVQYSAVEGSTIVGHGTSEIAW